MALSLLGIFLIAFAVVSYFRKRHDRFQEETDERFWEREAAANHVRRKDISGLPYINIPFEDFSIGAFSDEKITEIETALAGFRDKKILNLGGQTNTDLKLQYGPANLAALTEYDQNFTDLLHVLNDYSNRLLELGHSDAAISILEFCVNIGSDISTHYTTLANCYKAAGQTDELNALREKASMLDSIMKDSILQKIDGIICS